MMYSYELTIPVNTPMEDPAELICPLTHGVIQRIEVQFPSGCAGLAGGRVFVRDHQQWPTNVNAWFISDGYVIEWPDEYELTSLPYEVTVRGYNVDDTYPHTLTFRFAVSAIEDTLAARIGRLFGPKNVGSPG